MLPITAGTFLVDGTSVTAGPRITSRGWGWRWCPRGGDNRSPLPPHARAYRLVLLGQGTLEYRQQEGEQAQRVRRLAGFALPSALLTGIETRTSSPMRIARDERCESPNLAECFPAGEGAGYAGGVFSAGVDGIAYVTRGLHQLPRQGDRPAWRHAQDYWSEKDELPSVNLDEEALVYATK